MKPWKVPVPRSVNGTRGSANSAVLTESVQRKSRFICTEPTASGAHLPNKVKNFFGIDHNAFAAMPYIAGTPPFTSRGAGPSFTVSGALIVRCQTSQGI